MCFSKRSFLFSLVPERGSSPGSSHFFFLVVPSERSSSHFLIGANNCCTIFILSEFFPNRNAKLKITPPVSMLFGFRRNAMLEYIYNGHSIAYDPISSGEET